MSKIKNSSLSYNMQHWVYDQVKDKIRVVQFSPHRQMVDRMHALQHQH